MTYLYEGEKPDAASQIGEDRYTYDDNGNPTLIVSDSTTRTITWDEENRMVMLNDDGYVSRYTYDFSGTRVIKSHGPQESVYINGAEQGLDYHDADNYTLYVSPYLIVSNERFTKHYYAGTQRIASKVGSGDFYNVYGVNGFHLTAGDKDYKERLEQIEEGVKEYYNANGIPPGEPTMKGSNADPYVAEVALPNAELGDYSVPTDWPTNVKFNEPGDVPGPVVQFEDDDQGDVKAGYGFESDNLYEGDWFFFHTDHLGSTSYLTDTAGNVSQFVCYTPYGEAIVDEHLTTYENPFKFSGKELDDITGLYDHGARSRNPVSTLWYGVDPLWEKYPDFSPYNYCAGNPVKLVDPDGRDWIRNKETNEISWNNACTSKESTPENFDYIGNEYLGLTVTDYNEYYDGARRGLSINLCYKDNNEGSNYQWIQSVKTNYRDVPGYKFGETEEFLDYDKNQNNPFYFSEEEQKQNTNIEGCTYVFTDRPVRVSMALGTYWEGELTLVQKTEDGYKPKFTITYGFEIGRGETKLYNIKFSKQTEIQQTALENFNKSLDTESK